MFYRYFIIVLCFFCISATSLHARIFTNAKGQKIHASITNVAGDDVQLMLTKNGKSYAIPISSLAKADQDYIKKWEQDNAKKDKPIKKNEAEKVKSVDMPHNFDASWPELISMDIDVEITVEEEDKEKKRFVYHSPNYEFICDVGLSKNVVKKFAVLFEATREYCRLLPISTMKAHVPGAQFRHKILLFENKEDYVKNGGPSQSAGVFISRGGNGIVMAPLSSLGLKRVGSSYMYDYKGSNKVLPHEITHQLTDHEYYRAGARGWFSEGLAEYVAVTPYRSGKYMVKSNFSAIRAYVTDYGKKGRGGRALTDKIKAPDLQEYMIQSYAGFTSNANFNYGLGLLITYYYFHMENDRSNITAFLKALKDGKNVDEALAILLNGRSWDEMEEQISKAWKSRGVKINFN